MASDPRVGRVPERQCLEKAHAGCFQPLKWSRLESHEDQRMESLTSGFFHGCEDPGHRDAPHRRHDHSQARGRPCFSPKGPPPPSHLSMLKTTEEKKVFFFATHSFWYT